MRRDKEEIQSAGHRAYAEEQIAMWTELARVSEVRFKKANINYHNIDTAD